MPMQDSDPERRNLMVTSIAFIAYFYAGGSFPESNVRLQVINAEFSQPEILALIAWSTFCWFIYRYWVTHRGNFIASFSNEFTEIREKLYIINFLNKELKQTLHINEPNNEYYASNLRWVGGSVVATCNYASITRNPEGKIVSSSSGGGIHNRAPKYIKFKGIKGWFLVFRATLSCIIKQPSFSNYVVPYFLSFLAILGAALRYIF